MYKSPKNSHTLFDFMYPSGTNELWQDIVGYEDGGFVGYQYGGGATIEGIMEEAGMTMTPEQRAQFENPDPTTVNRIAEDIQSGMEASGRGGAESVASQGFIGSGHGTKAMADVRSEAVNRLGRATEDYQKELTSQTLGTAAGMVTDGAEFGEYRPPKLDYGTGSTDSGGVQEFSIVPTGNMGDMIRVNGEIYTWDFNTNSYTQGYKG